MAFTHEERAALGIEALLPAAVQTLAEQVELARAQILAHPRPLDRFVALAELEGRNTVLFHRVLVEHLEEMLPLVYTPTVGDACEHYSQLPVRRAGVWITPRHRGRIREVLEPAIAGRDVRLIVLTDNERILGLGDLGAGGIGIPIGKLALYTAAAGLHPMQVLPISLDVGTDNRRLLEDPRYVGVHERRLRGAAYEALIEELIDAIRACCPRALLQWEDFKKGNALGLLERYRDRVLSFNDDVEGTAAVALAGVIAASRVSGVPMRAQRVVILGAGAAGLGIARLLRRELREQGAAEEDARAAIAVLDSRGLLIEGRAVDEAYKAELALPRASAAKLGLDVQRDYDLRASIEAFAPTALIGTSGQARAFEEASVRAMAARTSRPAIFPLSNPNRSSEADPSDLMAWTDGRALIATGSPFPDVEHAGRTFRAAQGNNVWIFPGVGLGALAARASRVGEGMFTAAAHALAGAVSEDELAQGQLYPRIPRLRAVAVEVAVAVARAAIRDGDALPLEDGVDLRTRVLAMQWYPAYPQLNVGR